MFRAMTDIENKILQKITEIDFPEMDIIKAQIKSAYVEEHISYNNVWYKFQTKEDVEVIMNRARIPVSIVTEQTNGIPVECLLHVCSGRVTELEIYTQDGRKIELDKICFDKTLYSLDNGEQYILAEKVKNKLISALLNQDKEGVKQLFSPAILLKKEHNINEMLTKIIETFLHTHNTLEEVVRASSGKYGKKGGARYCKMIYKMLYKKSIFYLHVLICTVDWDSPQWQGIHTLAVISQNRTTRDRLKTMIFPTGIIIN